MYNSNIKKNRRILVLLFITITISFMNFGQLNWNFNNSTNDSDSLGEIELFKDLKTSDYSSNYGGTGENISISLHQSYLNNSFNIFDIAIMPPFLQ